MASIVAAQTLDADLVMEERDDNTLIEAIAQRRDCAAFAELCTRYEKLAYALAFRTLRNSNLSEDAVQEAMLSVWLSAKSYNFAQLNAQGWILSIVMKKSIDLGRKLRRSSKREDEITMCQGRTQVAAVEDTDRNELLAKLRDEIDKLPELERTLLAGFYGASMPQREIARLVGISQKTVSNKIQQTLSRIRLNLTQAGVAAVVPLLSAENLVAALTTGHEAPPGLSAKVIRRIESMSSHSVRMLSYPTTAKAVVVAIGIAVCAAAIILVTKTWSPPTTPKPTYRVANEHQSLVESPWTSVAIEPIRIWHFDPNAARTQGPTTEYDMQDGSDAVWNATQNKTGSTLTQSLPVLKYPSLIVAGPPVIGANEWTAVLDETSGLPSGEVGFAATSNGKDGIFFGKHSFTGKISALRIVSWPTASGTRIVSIRESDGKKWIGSDELKGANAQFNIAFYTNSALTIKSLCTRPLPSDWRPGNDPQIGPLYTGKVKPSSQ